MRFGSESYTIVEEHGSRKIWRERTLQREKDLGIPQLQSLYLNFRVNGDDEAIVCIVRLQVKGKMNEYREREGDINMT